MKARFTPILGGALAAAVVLGASAGGEQPHAATASKHKRTRPTNLATSKDLWSTINVCDTNASPNTIGIRGSMPGLGTRPARLRMRFQVQYKAKADGKWHNAGDTADSGYALVGRTRRQVVESGQNFTFEPPGDGGSHLLRGSVRYQWKRSGKVVARARRFTEPGHVSTAGAQPKGYSAAQCEIVAP